ncbi:MAG: zeta toxin family protein [Lacunisphaera sp.]|nr:zeta toxin family protein [Lacunisphaera sp.]
MAGPNGAGKTTYYRTFLSTSGLPFLNADELTRTLDVPNAEAAKFVDEARAILVANGESFITETIFSDPVGAKLDFLRRAIAAGYEVQVHFIGIAGVDLSEARVIQRVAQGGHDVPQDRLERRFQQSLRNLAAAITFVPDVRVFDNSDTDQPFRLVLRTERGRITFREQPLPDWLVVVTAA